MNKVTEVDYLQFVETQAAVTEQPSKLKPFPAVGDSLVILHEIKRGKRNKAVLGYQRNSHPVKCKVAAVYLDGNIRDQQGDVWEVKPGKLGQWETINPEREAAIKEGKV